MISEKIDWTGVFQAVPHGVVVADLDFNIVFVNRAFCDMTSVSQSAAQDRKCFDVFPGPLCHSPECPLNRIRSGEECVSYAAGKHCKSPQALPCAVTAHVWRNAGGQTLGVVETFSDVSQLRKARAALIQSHERLRKAMGGIIQAMSLAIEKRDPYTAGHQRRVTKLCRAIGTRLGLDWEILQGLRMAAAVHDIGKIQVPAAILNKPGKLSEPEWAILKQHALIGYEILKGIDFPWPLAEAVYQHHERLDGSGYPRGLKGDAIILEARILSVADVAEAISSFRPYRPALGIKAAIRELKSGRGIRYDEKIADICIDLLTVRGFDFTTKSWQTCLEKQGHAANT